MRLSGVHRWWLAACLVVAALAACQPAAQVEERSGNASIAAVQTAAAAYGAPDAGSGTNGVFTPVMREFDDYVVGCDNTGTCTLVGVPADHEEGMALMVSRTAGEKSQTRLSLLSNDALNPMGLRLDGKLFPDGAAWNATADGVGLNYGSDVEALLGKLSDARWLSSGKGTGHRVSLTGLKAAMLFVDDFQGRVDTPSAWIGKGNEARTPPVAAPAPILANAPASGPALGDAQAKELAMYVRRQGGAALDKAAQALGIDSCEADGDGGADDRTFPLTANDALVAVQCISGAYQGSSLLFRVNRAMKAPPVVVDLPPSPGADASSQALPALLVDPVYGSGALTSKSKGRGLGDCGDLKQWRFDGERFVLAWSARLDRCGGVTADYWPVLWRSGNADSKALEDS